ncbi:MAG: T9SS type A sorting domain-containing protein, partial [Saprospiraceae bacterium]
HWIPWNLVDSPTNIISAEVSTDFASNGTKSMKVRQDGTAGDDQLLQLGDKSTGRYELKWKYYIPAGRATYFNIQTTEIVPQPAPPSANFATEVYFRATGIVDQVSPTPIVSGTFPFDTWFPVKLIVDLDNNLAKLFVNGNLIRGWVYTGDFGAIDFYAADATYLAYVDEVEYIQLPALVYNVDVCDAAVDLTLFFGQATPQTTGIYDNTNATVAATDPTVDCWNEADPGEDILNNTMWYTFVGDGKKYHIETVPCNATNYITGPGDTQMLVYAGDDCANLTEIVCNDDLSFAQFQDWRAGVDIETDPGQTYYMLIDGFDNVGTVSVGEFCIEISVLASVLCADAVMGTYEVSSPFLCEGAQLADLVTIDPGTFTIPNEGLVSGLVWAITTSPVNPAIFPTQANGLVGSTGYMADPFVLGHVNDGTPFAFNVYYITPILVGSGVDTDPLNGPSLFDTDPSGGCFFIGASTQVVFLPLTDDITVTAVAGASSVNATAIGGIAGITLDPSSYTYLWSNGATTEDLTGVPLGTYTVTVSDECSFEGTASAVVTIVGTKDPASIQSLVVSPNPTVGIVTLNLALATAAEVRIEVLNTLGQTLQTLNAGKLSNLSQKVDLNSMAQGSYFLRVTVDGETAIRRVLVQR